MLLFCVNIYGQRTCGNELNLTVLKQTDPERYQRVIDLENQIRKSLKTRANVLRSPQQSTIITIPVVVHIVYNNNMQNISDTQVHSQIQVLNWDFRRLSYDRGRTPKEFASIAGDANIEFKLAKTDPFGNYTTGITRTFTSKSQFYYYDNNGNINDDVKYTARGGHDAWNTQRYLNLWVCNLGNDLLGYAQFPSELYVKPNTDGVVINYQFFGRYGSAVSPYDQGRTATHEIGHWLNLWHIWGDDDNANGYCSSDECSGSDEVDDTPNQGERNIGCPTFPKTDCCTPFSPGVMFMNYMDYTDDACMNMFTNGQIERMRAVFDTYRSEMLRYSHCFNEIKDGNETDIDCGGDCALCGIGGGSGGGGNSYVKPTCDDGIKNQDETGIDCGGFCRDICGFGGKLNDIVKVNTDCIEGRLDNVPVGNTPPIFSGENIVNTENIKVSHGGYNIDNDNNNDHQTTLRGGIFFEQKGYQFHPYRKYKITINFYSQSTYHGPGDRTFSPLHFAFANDLVDKTDRRYYSNGHYYYTSNNCDPLTERFYIGNLTSVVRSCPASFYPRYVEVTLTIQPNDYYKQLWIYSDYTCNPSNHHINTKFFFNSLKITEVCPPNNLIIHNNNKGCMEDTIIASDKITFENLQYNINPFCLTKEFIAGKEMVIKNNVRITAQNQGYVRLHIDNNYICDDAIRPHRISQSGNNQEEPNLTETLQDTPASISLFPNPTTGIVNILVLGDVEIKSINVFDVAGRVLKSNAAFAGNTLDLSDLSNGIYLVQIRTSAEQATHKVTIKK